jgi:hypothetical protein
MTDNNVNWPGWRLEDNPHGKEFDLEARKRMLSGSNKLEPFIQKYKDKMGQEILEIGPFFNPLITSEKFPNASICYWENDYHVLGYHLKESIGKPVHPIFCDLNLIEGDSFLKLKLETQKLFKDGIQFDSIVISHVFNYVDYKMLLMVLKDFIKKGGLIFINNVVDYGLPAFFSDKRPKSIESTIETIEQTGYKIIEKDIQDSPYKEHQKNQRLIVVAKSVQ